MYVNPALTGSADGDYRASAIFRNQWGSITNPYRTIGLSFDARTNKNVALGVNVLNQSAGEAVEPVRDGRELRDEVGA